LFAFAERFFEDVRVLLDLAYSDHVFLGFDFISFYGKFYIYIYIYTMVCLDFER
jgi:hypothetical protein